ncbi:MAG: hypothetical protein JSR80_03140 [Verrucomicrobia bacterium]|nr:hypothetical protein [Verrucomicrobiota bacterium]
MFRLLSTLIFLGVLAFAGWWVWNNVPEVRAFVEKHLDTSSVQTLEVRHTAEQIMGQREQELLNDPQHTYLRPALLFSPYLLMEVKYTNSAGQTREGVILWGLEDGEMVLDTETWERTHGFQDCINSRATRSEFRVLNALAKGALTREKLADQLRIDPDLLDNHLESCRQKQLIVQKGGLYRLHLEKPKLAVEPQTKLKQALVTKPSARSSRSPRRYSKAEIELVAQSAFGSDFAIRSSKEVFLPIYSIVVQNPDGTRLTSYWNALNGQRVSAS